MRTTEHTACATRVAQAHPAKRLLNAPPHPTLQALRNLRLLALFLIGPMLGAALVGSIFRMPTDLYLLAGGMFLFSLTMLLTLVAAERRRIADS
ncbi:MAG: hypothetical protein P8Y78_03635 [Acidihalobacter sp.]